MYLSGNLIDGTREHGGQHCHMLPRGPVGGPLTVSGGVGNEEVSSDLSTTGQGALWESRRQ